MEPQVIAALADRLLVAEETYTPIEVLSLEYPDLTVEDGYRIQAAIITKKCAPR
jgi:2-keto-4-pentenoate hydratase